MVVRPGKGGNAARTSARTVDPADPADSAAGSARANTPCANGSESAAHAEGAEGLQSPGMGAEGIRTSASERGLANTEGATECATEGAAEGAEVTVEDIRGAQKMLSSVTRVTPLEGSRHLSGLVGSPVHFKCENLQRTGSFKLRGAYVRIARLSAAERAAGVVAASAGNHAQGVALAASLLGVRSTVFMPTGAALPKIAATREYGADVRLHGHVVDEALEAAREHARRTGAVFIHPFDHSDVVAGQGTIGLEILEQCPEVRCIVVGVGGGGLAAGIAVAVKRLRPDVKVIGVQAEGAAAYPPSLAAGHPVLLERMSTMADGIMVGRPGGVPFKIIGDLVDEVRTVSEDALSSGLLLCLERAKLVVEPAGASPVAALLSDPKAFEGPVVAVLSGGNVDPLVLMRTLRHGMAAAGRYLSLRLRLADRPGALAALLGELSVADANVLDVGHVRTDPRLGLTEAEVELHLETKGPEHCAQVAAALRAAGYTVTG